MKKMVSRSIPSLSSSGQRKKIVARPSNLPIKPSKQLRVHYDEGFLKSNGQSQLATEDSDHDLDSDSDSYSSESEEINTNKKTKPRGKTVLSKIWNYEGPPKTVEFNAYGQCVDDGELARFCGTIARTPNLTPLEYLDWRKFPSEKKDAIWDIVKSKYDVPLSGKKWVLGKVGNQLRCFKNDLYNTNFHKYSSLTELQNNPDPRTSKEQWEKLVDKWYSSEWQKKSQTCKDSQRKSKLPHSSGTISFARRSEIQLKETGRRPSRARIYLDFHKPKEGKDSTPESKKILDDIKGKCIAEEANDNVSEVRDHFTPIEGDILSETFGPDKHGRVRGMGFGVTPTMFSKSNFAVIQENQGTRDEIKILKETLAQMEKENSNLKELLNNGVTTTSSHE